MIIDVTESNQCDFVLSILIDYFKKRDAKGIFTQTLTNRFYGFIVEEAIFQNGIENFLSDSNGLLISTTSVKMEIFKEKARITLL